MLKDQVNESKTRRKRHSVSEMGNGWGEGLDIDGRVNCIGALEEAARARGNGGGSHVISCVRQDCEMGGVDSDIDRRCNVNRDGAVIVNVSNDGGVEYSWR